MVRVLLIVAATATAVACAGAGAPQPAPVAPLSETAPPVPDSLWDRGTFVQFDKNVLLEHLAEKFEIYQTAAGYRFVVSWERPAPTGEPGDGKVTLETDPRFSPISGEMVSTLRTEPRAEVTRSRIFRDTGGRFATEIQAADGTKESARSKGPNDWYIGGTITSFLVALCGADPSFTAPKVYPDKDTTLEPPQPLPIEGSPRTLTYRRLTYTGSGRVIVAACEDGKLAGEYTRGATIVRSGDLALARALDARFR